MKRLLTILLLLTSIFSSAFAQAEKEMVKSISLDYMNHVMFALPGDVHLSEWDNDFIKVTTQLKVPNFPSSIVDKLVMVGRYRLGIEERGDQLIITMPKVKTYVTVKGVDLVEELSFDIQIPAGFSVSVKDSTHQVSIPSL